MYGKYRMVRNIPRPGTLRSRSRAMSRPLTMASVVWRSAYTNVIMNPYRTSGLESTAW